MVSPSAESTNNSFWKSRWLSVLLIAADAVAFFVCWKGGWFIREAMNPVLGPINSMDPYLRVAPLMAFAGVANCAAFGLYMHRRRLSSLNRPSTLIRVGYHWLLYIVVVAFFFKELDLGRSIILFSAALGLVYLFGSRTVFRVLKARALARGRGTVRCVIVGTGELALEVREFLRMHPEIGYTLAGMVRHPSEPDADEHQLAAAGVRLLESTEELNQTLASEKIEEVFLAIAHLKEEDQLRLLNTAERPGIAVHVVSNIFDVISDRAKVEEIGRFPVVTLKDGSPPLHQRIMKRTMDIVLSAVGVVVWLLFFHWWIALLIKRDGAGPILFRQKRVGRLGREFVILKYRTMKSETNPYTTAPVSEEDPRITPSGRWLRRTSLDELPQLLNVLKGDMSLVGPRPEMAFIVEQYKPWERRRLDVKPGVTGLWQVIGRKNLPLSLNMQYDLYYIKNQSFLLDIEILLRTIPAVLKGKGAF